MKTQIVRSLVFTALVALTLGACNSKDAEKKIAAAEEQLQKSPAPTATVPQPEAKPEGPLPAFQFETTKHDFGTLKEGDPAEFTYKFTNNGAAPLVISSVKPSCGCTVPEYSQQPIAVGGSGFVKVKFDTNGKSNVQNKTVTVIANTYPKEITLNFTAVIVPKAGPSAK
ncbi:DUF1573 domain-containing protein [Pseudochryseolinea flava]|nr:DUF1573 domain-containing protein [Pseudochryseolinea flava]